MIQASELLPQTPAITAPRRKVRKLHLQAAEREAKRAARTRQQLARAQAKVEAAKAAGRAAFERLTRTLAKFEAIQKEAARTEAVANPFSRRAERLAAKADFFALVNGRR